MTTINLIYCAVFVLTSAVLFLFGGLDEGLAAERRCSKKAGAMKLRKQTVFTRLAWLEQKRRGLVVCSWLSALLFILAGFSMPLSQLP